MTPPTTTAALVCTRPECGWVEVVNGNTDDTGSLPDLLKAAWSVGLEHAWDHRGHIVETFVNGRLKATQQVADMSPWHSHNTVTVEEGGDS